MKFCLIYTLYTFPFVCTHCSFITHFLDSFFRKGNTKSVFSHTSEWVGWKSLKVHPGEKLLYRCYIPISQPGAELGQISDPPCMVQPHSGMIVSYTILVDAHTSYKKQSDRGENKTLSNIIKPLEKKSNIWQYSAHWLRWNKLWRHNMIAYLRKTSRKKRSFPDRFTVSRGT